MDKNYNPAQIEPKWYEWWERNGLFHSDPSRPGEPYCIVIPPPNVTGILHMGHALNNTIQDVLARWRRMQGRNVVWLPGTDHAGIATQNVVERALRAESKTREDLGREAFVERVWQWRAQYGGTIVRQLRRLGASCDWARERFTMDEGLSAAVVEVFVRLYEKGLIYRANYIINWCPRCHTALSDEESEHVDTDGKLYYLRYPIGACEPGRPHDPAAESVTVATTRPETLLGDVAVAVNPKDERYRGLADKAVMLPVLGRRLAVIEDDFVDPQFGTGVVKVTPAHDPNDFDMGRRHGLTPVNVMNGDGTMNEEAGPYAGMDRFECRKRIVERLEAEGLLVKVEKHRHAVGHCYRCESVVEPRLSPQWFVKMKPLASPAIEAVRSGKVRFVPERWTGVYLDWMENIRDWCISRQIWWGHRIPVFYCDGCGHQWVARSAPAACPACRGARVRQDQDVLDTWFSSWLWPFSTFGWPQQNRDLSFYYPTHDLVTASEIIFFWVARMIVAGIEFMGDVPFRQVYIHGTVRDDSGRKMSKSLGNSIDPLTVIDEFSADALRFSLMMITATGQDLFLSNDKFEIGRNFGTKIWNAARYLGMQGPNPAAPGDLRPPELDPALLSFDDRQILGRLQETIESCETNLERYRFNDASLALYEFVWHQFCDWYVESSKRVLQEPGSREAAQALRILYYVFGVTLRLLHPVVPFLTEELWHAMGYGGESDSISRAPWPQRLPAETLAAWGVDRAVVAYVDQKHDMIRAARMLKADCGIAASAKARYLVKPSTAQAETWLKADLAATQAVLRAESLAVDAALAAPKGAPACVTALGTVYMPVEGLIDTQAETRRLSEELRKVEAHLGRVNAQLENVDFLSRARKEIIERQKGQQQQLVERSDRLRGLVEALSQA